MSALTSRIHFPRFNNNSRWVLLDPDFQTDGTGASSAQKTGHFGSFQVFLSQSFACISPFLPSMRTPLGIVGWHPSDFKRFQEDCFSETFKKNPTTRFPETQHRKTQIFPILRLGCLKPALTIARFLATGFHKRLSHAYRAVLPRRKRPIFTLVSRPTLLP